MLKVDDKILSSKYQKDKKKTNDYLLVKKTKRKIAYFFMFNKKFVGKIIKELFWLSWFMQKWKHAL